MWRMLSLISPSRPRLFTIIPRRNPLFIDLPLTRTRLMVPTWIHIMPDGALLEDNGVPPDLRLSPGRDALAVAVKEIRGRLK